MGEFNADLGFGKLSWLSSYRELDRDEHRHQGPTGGARSAFTGNFWQLSQELRLSMGGTGFWKAQVGGYYFKERSRLVAANVSANVGFIQNPTVAVSKALFAQGTITPAEGLNLTAGVRYSHDDKSRIGVIAADPLGTPVVTGVNDAARSFSKVTWRLGVDYDLPRLGLVYATVSTGYKAGGSTTVARSAADRPAPSLQINSIISLKRSPPMRRGSSGSSRAMLCGSTARYSTTITAICS